MFALKKEFVNLNIFISQFILLPGQSIGISVKFSNKALETGCLNH